MVTYRYINRGRVRYAYPQTLQEAVQLAARDHNNGKIVDEIVDNKRRYNRQEILTICNNLGLLR